jgi:hypothetical protein
MMHCVTEHHIRRGCGLPLHNTQRFNEAVPNCMVQDHPRKCTLRPLSDQGKFHCSELSSGLYCRVNRLSTDVSEVRTASIIRDE